MNNTARPGKIIVLSGPSGVGKTTICHELMKRCKHLRYSTSATSRPKRKGEKDGREYFFLTRTKFGEWIKKGWFVEYALVHGHLYGTPRISLLKNIKKGRDVLMDVDVQGGRNLMKEFPDGIFIFILPPDFSELEKRLKGRNTEKRVEITDRLKRARQEIKYKRDYKYKIENRNLKKTVEKIVKIIIKETTR